MKNTVNALPYKVKDASREKPGRDQMVYQKNARVEAGASTNTPNLNL